MEKFSRQGMNSGVPRPFSFFFMGWFGRVTLFDFEGDPDSTSFIRFFEWVLSGGAFFFARLFSVFFPPRRNWKTRWKTAFSEFGILVRNRSSQKWRTFFS